MALSDFFTLGRRADRWGGSLAGAGMGRSGCWPSSGCGAATVSDFWRPGETGHRLVGDAGRRMAGGLPGAAEVGLLLVAVRGRKFWQGPDARPALRLVPRRATVQGRILAVNVALVAWWFWQ